MIETLAGDDDRGGSSHQIIAGARPRLILFFSPGMPTTPEITSSSFLHPTTQHSSHSVRPGESDAAASAAVREIRLMNSFRGSPVTIGLPQRFH